MRIEQHAWLSVVKETADFDPTELTRAVGIEPTEAWRYGDPHDRPIPRGSVRRRTSLWSYRTEEVATRDGDDLLLPLVELFEQSALVIAEFADQVGAEVGLGLCAHNWGELANADGALLMEAPYVGLGRKAIGFLAKANAEFEFNQWLYLEGLDGLTETVP